MPLCVTASTPYVAAYSTPPTPNNKHQSSNRIEPQPQIMTNLFYIHFYTLHLPPNPLWSRTKMLGDLARSSVILKLSHVPTSQCFQKGMGCWAQCFLHEYLGEFGTPTEAAADGFRANGVVVLAALEVYQMQSVCRRSEISWGAHCRCCSRRRCWLHKLGCQPSTN